MGIGVYWVTALVVKVRKISPKSTENIRKDGSLLFQADYRRFNIVII